MKSIEYGVRTYTEDSQWDTYPSGPLAYDPSEMFVGSSKVIPVPLNNGPEHSEAKNGGWRNGNPEKG